MATVGYTDLVRLIEINGLLGEKQLGQLKQQADKDIDPKTLLKKLLERGKITRWQAKQLMQGEERLKIGNMILTDEVGTSSLGELYQARQTGLNRSVTLLVLSDEFQNDEDLLARFGERVGSFSEVHHEALIRPIEIEKQDDQVVMAMDHYSGSDLFDRVREVGPLEKHETVKLVKRLNGLIVELHDQDEVHGELTPASIIFDDEDVARVLCFDPTPTDDAERTENAEYFLSPLAEDDPEDAGIDLFSIGRIGLFALSGEFPDEDYIASHKSPLVTLFSRMSATDDTRIVSLDKVNKLLDRWLELNVDESEEGLEDAGDNQGSDEESHDDLALAISDDDYQADGAAGALNFGIDTGASSIQERLNKTRGGGASAKSDVAKADLDEGTDSESTSDGESKKLSTVALLAIIGGAVGFLLLLGGIAAIVVFSMGGSDDEAIARSNAVFDASQNVTEGEAATEPDDTEVDKPIESPLVASTLATETKSATDVEAPKADETGEGASTPVSTDAGKEAGSETSDATKQTPAPKTPNETKPVTTPPEVKPPAGTKPETTTPPEIKPDAKKTDEKKPAPESVINIPSMVAIPDPGSTKKPGENFGQPISLGKVKLHPGEYFSAKLHGGEFAFKEGAKFDLNEIASDDREWQVRFIPNVKKETDASVIGDLIIVDDILKFTWREEALKVPAAGNLRNCVLGLKTGRQMKFASLRQPIQIEPLVLDERFLAGKVDAKIDNMPDADLVRVEILGAGKDFPKHKFDKENILPSGKGETFLKIGEPSHEFVVTKINSRGRGKISLNAASMMTLKGMEEKVPSNDDLKKLLAKAREIKKSREKMVADVKKMKEPDRRKFSNSGAAAQVNLQIVHATENIVRLDALVKSIDKLRGHQIKLRVFYKAGDYEVELATPTGKPIKDLNKK